MRSVVEGSFLPAKWQAQGPVGHVWELKVKRLGEVQVQMVRSCQWNLARSSNACAFRRSRSTGRLVCALAISCRLPARFIAKSSATIHPPRSESFSLNRTPERTCNAITHLAVQALQPASLVLTLLGRPNNPDRMPRARGAADKDLAGNLGTDRDTSSSSDGLASNLVITLIDDDMQRGTYCFTAPSFLEAVGDRSGYARVVALPRYANLTSFLLGMCLKPCPPFFRNQPVGLDV